MAKSRRGGYRQPSKPAAVATPQGGQRTDGGPGSEKQPLRRIPGVAYGEQKALTQQQQAAPLAGGGQSTPMPQQQAQPARPDVFAPTERPMEPITQGAAFGPGSGPADQSGCGFRRQCCDPSLPTGLSRCGRRRDGWRLGSQTAQTIEELGVGHVGVRVARGPRHGAWVSYEHDQLLGPRECGVE